MRYGMWMMVLALAAVGCQSDADKQEEQVKQRVHDKVQHRFVDLDMDKDGKLTRQEFAASQVSKNSKDPVATFDRADLNKDGVLTPGELDKVVDAYYAQ